MTSERQCRRGLHVLRPGERYCKPCKEARRRERNRIRSGAIGPDETIECPACHLPFQVIRTEHVRTHGFQDIQAFKGHFGLESCLAPAQRKRVSKQFKGKKTGRRDNGRRGLKHTPEARAKMSAAAVARCLRNPGPLFAGIQGEWVWSEKADREVYVRSSYEKRLLGVLDQHPEVEELDVEPFAIPYEFDGVALNYIPDFLVAFVSGIREVWEVKDRKFLDDPQNRAKFVALNDYVTRHGMNAAIVTLEDIKRMERWSALHHAVGFTSWHPA